MRDSKLDILFEPLEMPNLTLKNRFFMAPLGTTFDVDQLTNYLVARARGEAALITTAEISVHRSGRAGMPKELCLETDDDIKTFSQMVKAVQKAGARIVAQLNHAGRYSFGKLLGQQPVAPSPIASKYTGETPRELMTSEIDDLLCAFAGAALRARKAGFDGVELCACSGYLISQFLSPLTNKRKDKYGQRAVFLLSILQEIRNRVGDDFNICVKFDAEDGMEGGKTLEDSLLLAPHIVEAGADRLHIWAGWHEATRPMLPMSVPRGAFSYLAAAIKGVVDVPISTVGRINDPYVAAGILERGEADLIGLGRTLLADPDFVRKTMEGRTREIRRCTACSYCFDQLMLAMRGDKKSALKCSINPELGHEGEGLIQAAGQRKYVVVVGGGPAGMEAARLSAIRGHRVTLYEKDTRLGGMINLAFIPPYKEELKNVVDYYVCQMEILPVEVKLGESFTPEKIGQIKPDVVVLAAGARELMPDIPGIRSKQVVSALKVLEGTASVQGDVVIIGGGMIGIETAEFFADKGEKVTVIEQLKSVAADVGPTTRWGLLSRIRRKVKIFTLTEVVEVKADSVIVRDQDNNKREIPAGTVVVATGLVSHNELAATLDQTGAPYFMVGSCREPGQIAEAIADGFTVGCKI